MAREGEEDQLPDTATTHQRDLWWKKYDSAVQNGTG